MTASFREDRDANAERPRSSSARSAAVMRRDARPRRRVVACLTVLTLLGAVALLPVTSATWSASTSLPATISAAASFPGLPAVVNSGGPVFYHRGEETGDTPAGTVAEDSSTNNLDGTYSIATDDSSLWWRLDEDTNATSWADASGSTNTGGPSGTPSTITNVGGPTGGGLLLGETTASCCFHSGAGAAAVSARLAPFAANSAFTVSMWVYVGTLPTGTTRLGMAHVTNSSHPRSDVVLHIDANAANCPVAPCWTFAMARDPASATVTTWDTVFGPPAVANTWTHLTGVFNPSTPLTAMTLYVNGARQGIPVSHAIPASAATDRNIGFGRYRNGNWTGYGGETLRIGEPRTWRRAISAAEIQHLQVRPTSRYTFNEAAGTTPRYSTSSTATSYLTAITANAGPAVSGYSSTGVTMGAGATLSAGRDGNALTMSTASATGYLQGPAAQLSTSGSFSAAAWVRLTDASADRTIIAQNASTAVAAATRFVVGYEKASDRFFFRVWQTSGGASTVVYSGVAPVVNQWMHVAAAFQANTQMRLYVNGALAPSGGSLAIAFAGWAATGAVQAGRLLSGGATVAPWQGQIDDLRVYQDFALADATVRLLLGGIGTDPPGGLNGSTKTGHAGSVAMAFGGSSNGYNSKYSAAAATAAFTVECLVRVAPGDSGVIAGFAANPVTLAGTSSDRMLYVDSGGKVRFGVLAAGTPVTVASAAAIDTGAWFHVMGSVGARGLILAVTPATANPAPAIVTHTPPPTVTAAATGTGYWRWGGAPLLPAGTWPAAPQNPYLTGTVDEFVIYDRQLTEQELYWRVYSNY
ncbi:LamG-like jellyroll fold domain-containing protein [Actinoplanes sp. NPDC023801]|uniref:LamG-like jellyroll fold domain-containing protein n=1 Tax=Actinoplanes sp. NPDC023801 TaxID=3154595 RepID=UPI0033DEAF7C